MNPPDPTQRMREILDDLQQPSKKPYPGEKLKRTNIALAELTEIMDEVRIEELYMAPKSQYTADRIKALQQPKPSEE